VIFAISPKNRRLLGKNVIINIFMSFREIASSNEEKSKYAKLQTARIFN
jgi:hypothetical protein